MLEGWISTDELLSDLKRLDDNQYKIATSNYRNLSSHTIGPRIALGVTRPVTRTVTQRTTLVLQHDGTSKVEPVPGKAVVSYGIGGTPPLDPEDARVLNLQQFEIARKCFEDFRAHLFVRLSGSKQS